MGNDLNAILVDIKLFKRKGWGGGGGGKWIQKTQTEVNIRIVGVRRPSASGILPLGICLKKGIKVVQKQLAKKMML